MILFLCLKDGSVEVNKIKTKERKNVSTSKMLADSSVQVSSSGSKQQHVLCI